MHPEILGEHIVGALPVRPSCLFFHLCRFLVRSIATKWMDRFYWNCNTLLEDIERKCNLLKNKNHCTLPPFWVMPLRYFFLLSCLEYNYKMTFSCEKFVFVLLHLPKKCLLLTYNWNSAVSSGFSVRVLPLFSATPNRAWNIFRDYNGTWTNNITEHAIYKPFIS